MADYQCPACTTTMNEIPEADPILLRCPQCWTTIPKPADKPKATAKTKAAQKK